MAGGEKRREGETNPSAQNSVYYDATEHSHLIEPIAGIPEEPSPWQDDSAGPSILPAVHGYLSFNANTPSLPLSETETTFLDDDSLTTSAHSSYMGHLRAQSALPKKWLSEVDIDPYMRGRRKEFTGRRLLREPLLEELLPTSRKAALFPALNGPVSRKDGVAAMVFWIMFAIMMATGLLLCFVYPTELRDHIIRGSSMFRAIVDSSWILVSAIGVGSVVSVLWALLLRWFTTEIVTMMLYFAPLSALAAGGWALLEFLHADVGGGFWLLLAAVAGLSAAALSGMFIVANRKNVRHTVEIIKMTSEVLSSNPGIYVASFVLFVSYLCFIAVWLLFYVHTLMLGYVDPSHHVWHLSRFSYYLQAYLVFMLVWTSLIFSGVQKCLIGGVVGRWYFFRADPDELEQTSSVWSSLHAAMTTFFGQICIASLILSMVRMARLFFQFYHYVASRFDSGVVSTVLRSVTLFFGFVERLVEHLSDLALYTVALTGEGFWSAGRTLFKVFRRNMLLSFTTDALAVLLFTISTTAVAAITGLFSYIFVAHGLQSQYGFNAAMLFSLLTWYVLRFFTGIFSDTMDASFVCFAIDLDTEKLHSHSVHQAFSHRITTEGTM
ncbi:hypothetical protein PSACC_03715 [Paramicrosporidium saccamoebae]|uniref:Protein PNS1 n=1 Tax=Paramicrosporidium saccamoebae TaxID=1246581 RepID=A0A2H9TFQ7_9FUNG|nr:hypothetical protein PSACC_03715 [Paramicrosporidium saccamoebae]